MVTTKLNLSMTEPSVRQIYAKQGDTGRVLDISLDQTPEDGTLRILRPDGVEVTSEAVTGGEVESGGTFESLTEADVTELTVGIEPVQDLNGYGEPWVGGAGKNKYDDSAKTNALINERGAEITIASWYLSDYCAIPLGTTKVTLSWQSDMTYYQGRVVAYDSSKAFISGSYVAWDGTAQSHTFDIPSTASFVRVNYSHVVNSQESPRNNVRLNVGTSDLGYSPYSNICPITGHDEVRAIRTGKNLLENLASPITTNGITYTVNSDGSFSARGTATARANLFLRTVSNPQRLPKGNYILSQGNVFGVGEAFLELAIRRADGTTQYVNLNAKDNFAFTLNEGDYIYQPYFSVYSGTTIDATIYPMIRLASETDDAYEPYRSNTYTTPLGQTVYGGTLDMVSGVLTVDRAMVSLSGSDLNIGSSQTKELNMWRLPLNNPYGTLASSYPSGISNKYVMRNSYNEVNNNNGSVGLNQVNGSQILIRDDSLTTAQEVIGAFNSTPLTFVYPLATPQTYQLTPQQIKTLVGTNNVWASSGDIVSIKFTYGGLLSELPSDATSVVGKCYCDVEQNGVSSMPFTLNVKKNERAT